MSKVLTVESLKAEIKSQKSQIRRQAKMIDEGDNAILLLKKQESEKDAIINDLRDELKEAQKAATDYKESSIESLMGEIKSQKGQMNTQVKMIEARDKEIFSLRKQIEAIEIQGNEIKIRDYKIKALEADLKRQYAKIDNMENQTTEEKDIIINGLRDELKEAIQIATDLQKRVFSSPTENGKGNDNEKPQLKDEQFLISRINPGESFSVSFGKYIEFSLDHSRNVVFSREDNGISVYHPTEKSVIALANTKRNEIKYLIVKDGWLVLFAERYIGHDASWIDERYIERMLAAYRSGTWENEINKISLEKCGFEPHPLKSENDLPKTLKLDLRTCEPDKDKSSCEICLIKATTGSGGEGHIVNPQYGDVVFLKEYCNHYKNRYSILIGDKLFDMDDVNTGRDTSWITNWNNNHIMSVFEVVRGMYGAFLANRWDEEKKRIFDFINSQKGIKREEKNKDDDIKKLSKQIADLASKNTTLSKNMIDKDSCIDTLNKEISEKNSLIDYFKEAMWLLTAGPHPNFKPIMSFSDMEVTNNPFLSSFNVVLPKIRQASLNDPSNPFHPLCCGIKPFPPNAFRPPNSSRPQEDPTTTAIKRNETEKSEDGGAEMAKAHITYSELSHRIIDRDNEITALKRRIGVLIDLLFSKDDEIENITAKYNNLKKALYS